jgi:hypothetical protein
VTNDRSVPGEIRYVVTDAGREALESIDSCDCEIRLSGVLLTCAECGTVYGSVLNDRRTSYGRNGARRPR